LTQGIVDGFLTSIHGIRFLFFIAFVFWVTLSTFGRPKTISSPSDTDTATTGAWDIFKGTTGTLPIISFH
jgi:hypothetical protein